MADMKFVAVLAILWILQVGIIVFDNPSALESEVYNTTYNLNPYDITGRDITCYSIFGLNSSITTVCTESPDSVWNLLANPVTNWWLFLGIIASLFLAGVTAAVLIGIATSGGVSDLVYVLPLILSFIGFGAIPIINLWTLLTRESALWMCTGTGPCWIANLLVSTVVGVLGLYYIYLCLSFWRSGQ